MLYCYVKCTAVHILITYSYQNNVKISPQNTAFLKRKYLIVVKHILQNSFLQWYRLVKKLSFEDFCRVRPRTCCNHKLQTATHRLFLGLCIRHESADDAVKYNCVNLNLCLSGGLDKTH